jgi:hypothetical protein
VVRRNVRYWDFSLVSQFPPDETMARIARLLTEERVTFEVAGQTIRSVKTPIAIGSIQPQMFSKRNAFLMNPFTIISGIKINCEQGDPGLTKISVRVDRARAFLWVAFWVWCGLLVVAQSSWQTVALVAAGVTLTAWVANVWYFGGTLIRAELRDCLKVS